MSRTMTISNDTVARRNEFHADSFTPMRENHPTRHGIMKSLSPRKSVQVWCDKITHKGDLWVSDVLITEAVRNEILKVADIYEPADFSDKEESVLRGFNMYHVELINGWFYITLKMKIQLVTTSFQEVIDFMRENGI